MRLFMMERAIEVNSNNARQHTYKTCLRVHYRLKIRKVNEITVSVGIFGSSR